MSEEEKNQIIQKILKAIYWVKFSEYQAKNIISIVEMEESAMYRANEICEFLKIQKRDNRSAIASILQ